MDIYFDNAATTKPTDTVIDSVAKAMEFAYGNPSSAHIKGMDAENLISESRTKLAKLLGCRDDELIFTSGGTESNNLALTGLAKRHRREGSKIIVSPFEHPAILAQIPRLEEYGYKVSFAPVDKDGVVVLEELGRMIDNEVVLVSIMYVNNEIGMVQPIREIVELVKALNEDVLVHSDMVQAFGKYRINVHDLGLDAASISSHKFHGPKGVGALYLKKGINISPVIMGSGQQFGYRAGTENVPGIVGMAHAAVEVYADFEENARKFAELKQYLLDGLERIEDVFFFVNNEVCANHICSFGISNIRSEVMLHALEDVGVYVSNGAACSSKKKKKTGTLKALAVEDARSETAIRVSFNAENTKAEIDYFLKKLEELSKFLKRYVRK